MALANAAVSELEKIDSGSHALSSEQMEDFSVDIELLAQQTGMAARSMVVKLRETVDVVERYLKEASK